MGDSDNMKPQGRRRLQHTQQQMASSVDRIVFGRDIDQSEQYGKGR